jgi:hypothetical protein
MTNDTLTAAIEEIRAYTDAHSQLHSAHHFLYDSPLRKGQQEKPEFVIMGMNPGESCHDWKRSRERAEIMSDRDFNADDPSPNRRRWRGILDDLVNGRPAVLTELFFWSASSKDYQPRFGPWWKSEHLPFCVRMNKLLLDYYRPRAVIFIGIGCAKRAEPMLGLCHVKTYPQKTARLVEHYRDKCRPWFFIVHPTGARPSNDKKCKIKRYIHSDL